MLSIKINDRLFVVEFRHVTMSGKRRQLYDRSPVKAISTCVIACFDTEPTDSGASALKFIAIDNSICALSDNFSRREGRKNAVRKVLKHCGALKQVAQELWTAYLLADPGPAARGGERPRRAKDGRYYTVVEDLDGDHNLYVPRPERPRTVDRLKAAELKAEGQEGKFERRQARKQSKRTAREKAATS